jgi:hypothetical protein
MDDTAQTSAGLYRGPRLHGWDDEKIYLWVEGRGEFCVSDEPELMRRLVADCLDYYGIGANDKRG